MKFAAMLTEVTIKPNTVSKTRLFIPPNTKAKIAAKVIMAAIGSFRPPLSEIREERKQPAGTPILIMVMAVRVWVTEKPSIFNRVVVQVVTKNPAGVIQIKRSMSSRVLPI